MTRRLTKHAKAPRLGVLFFLLYLQAFNNFRTITAQLRDHLETRAPRVVAVAWRDPGAKVSAVSPETAARINGWLGFVRRYNRHGNAELAEELVSYLLKLIQSKLPR